MKIQLVVFKALHAQRQMLVKLVIIFCNFLLGTHQQIWIHFRWSWGSFFTTI